jgi:CHAT domain-containing protein
LLGFAPFKSAGYNDSAITFSKLPYTREEIKQENGKIFTDSAATKQNFLINSKQFPVLHLATHAAVDNINPEKSYIAFYPGTTDHLLYAPEIYNLDLDSTHLVILSACETGTGQLVRGEGLMSLSRAFAYAGCSNIITSLWKAEDRTTSFITQKLHYYLKNGYSKAIALQKSKIDLLSSSEFPPALKSPNYWAHLVFIGDYEPGRKSFYPTWLIMTVCLFIAGIIFWAQRRTKKADKKNAT